MTPNQLNQHDTQSLQIAYEGFKELEQARERENWQRTRFLAFYIRNLWLEKPLKKPTEWFRFEWEEPQAPTTPEATAAEKAKNKAISDKFDRIAAQLFK